MAVPGALQEGYRIIDRDRELTRLSDDIASKLRVTRAEVIREAITAYLSAPARSAYLDLDANITTLKGDIKPARTYLDPDKMADSDLLSAAKFTKKQIADLVERRQAICDEVMKRLGGD